MKRILPVILIFLIASAAFAAVPADSFRFIWDEGPIKAAPGGRISTKITLEMPHGHYLYVDKTDLEFVTLERIRITAVDYPRPASLPDPLGGAPVGIYRAGGAISVEMMVPKDLEDGVYTVSAILHYQGCTEKVCLRPQDKLISWALYVGDVSDEIVQPVAPEGFHTRLSSFMDLVKGKASETVLSIELKWLYIIAFLGGILSSLTPCILPLIPVTMLIIGVNPGKRWQTNFGLSLLLVLGMSLTYAVMGIAAAAMGKGLAFIFQSRLFIVFVVIFFLLMGLSLLGLYTFQLPLGIRNALSKLGGSGPRGAFLAGISMGLLATPCIGPIVGALLVYAASAGRMGVSFSLLVVYGIGLGAVIIIAGTWYGTVISRLKKAGVVWVKRFIGVCLIVTSLYYLHSLIPYTVFFIKADHPIKWQESYSTLLQPVQKETGPKMVLFSARWCPPCKILEAFTLKTPEIVGLSDKFTNIRVDATYSSPLVDALIQKYDVVGWPTILFISPEGIVYDDLRIFGGYITVSELADHMRSALERSEVGIEP